MTSATDSPDSTAGIAAGFRATLNRHGHGFHQAVMKSVESFGAPWGVLQQEFPVTAGHKTHHIDFVAILRRQPLPQTVYFVAECKRVNPHLADWCFAGVSQACGVGEMVSVDLSPQVMLDEHPANARPFMLERTAPVYEVGYTVRVRREEKKAEGSDAEREAKGQGREELTAALTQASCASSGFIDFLAADGHGLLTYDEPISTPKGVRDPRWARAFVVSVIVTTARLWTSSVDLAASDLLTGNVPEGPPPVRVPWLWYRFNVSPDLRHRLPGPRSPRTFQRLRDHVEQDFRRAVAIVSADGIETFLKDPLWKDYWD